MLASRAVAPGLAGASLIAVIAAGPAHGQDAPPKQPNVIGPIIVEAKGKKARSPQKAKAVPGVVVAEPPPPKSAPTAPSGGEFKSTLDLDAATTAGSRLPGTARDVPASVETINQATMQERGKETWVDALQGLTGFTSAVRPGASGVMSARGFNENGFALLYDGVRVSSTTISSRVYDSFIFDRIDVLRGPASVLYGEGAVGGAINLIHKAPSREEQPFESLTSVSSRDGFRLGVGKGGPIGDTFAYRINGVIHSFDGPVDGNEIEYGTLAGAFKWQINSKLSSTVDFDLMRSRIEDAYWGTPLVNGRIDTALRDVNYNNLPNNKYEDDVTWLRWKVDYEASSNLKFRNQLWSYQADRDWINAYRFVYLPAGAKHIFRGNTIENTTGSDKVYRLTWENLGYDHSFVGDRFDGTWTGHLGNMKASAVLGVEVGRTRWDSPRSEFASPQALDPLNPDPTDFFEHGKGRTDKVRAELGQQAVFGEGRLEVVPGVTLVGGFRKDWLQVDYERQPTNQLYDASYQPGTYRVGALWDIWRGTTLYAQYATAVEPRFALFTLGAGDTVFTLTEAKQVEVGVKQSFANGRGELVAALYHIDKSNIPSVDPATDKTVQVGLQSAKGVELAASWRPTDALRFDANIAFVDAVFEEFSVSKGVSFAGNRPANVPDTVANLGASWKALPLVTVGGWLHYHSSFMADDANTVSLPGAVIADVFASYEVSPAADLTFRVHNVTDEVYAAWATDANYVILGAPRTYSLTLRTRF
jgi:iron complex outermembrane receptor protein